MLKPKPYPKRSKEKSSKAAVTQPAPVSSYNQSYLKFDQEIQRFKHDKILKQIDQPYFQAYYIPELLGCLYQTEITGNQNSKKR